MSMIRNLITVLGLGAIVLLGIFLMRPDVYNNVMGKPGVVEAKPTAGQVYARFSAQRGTIIEDNSAPSEGLKFTFGELIDGEAVDSVPSSSAPYLMVINKAKNEIRYWKLNRNVRTVSLRENQTNPFDVKFKTISRPGEPFQAMLWIPRETDLSLKFEIGPIEVK